MKKKQQRKTDQMKKETLVKGKSDEMNKEQ
jgi:hypothetical protein